MFFPLGNVWFIHGSTQSSHLEVFITSDSIGLPVAPASATDSSISVVANEAPVQTQSNNQPATTDSIQTTKKTVNNATPTADTAETTSQPTTNDSIQPTTNATPISSDSLKILYDILNIRPSYNKKTTSKTVEPPADTQNIPADSLSTSTLTPQKPIEPTSNPADSSMVSPNVVTVPIDTTVAPILPPYALADSIALTVPKEATQNVHTLVEYFKKSLSSKEDLIRAFYTWLSHNISYNVYSTFVSRNEAYNKEKDMQEALDMRMGVCRQYSLLFNTMCQESGITSYSIYGYNKRGKRLLPDSHEWCTAIIDEEWYMFDATWGAGYVENYEFVSAPTDKYFMIPPDSMLQTHMPFDPMWQMRERPLSYREFDTGVIDTTRQVPYFAWKDTLQAYLKLDTLKQMENMYARMQAYPQRNPLVANAMHLTEANMGTIKLQRLIDTYNEAVDLQNQASDSINIFIRYRNTTFEPIMPDSAIWHMIIVPEAIIKQADSVINSIRETPEKYRAEILELRERIINVATRIYKERLFLQLYFDTPPKKRKSLFSSSNAI
ncbi:MAG: transglutaminase domain-containing protein [Bacteroides sp.]|nr:transglutaminase domain-containing protein [Bacteroides sp.]